MIMSSSTLPLVGQTLDLVFKDKKEETLSVICLAYEPPFIYVHLLVTDTDEPEFDEVYDTHTKEYFNLDTISIMEVTDYKVKGYI